MKRRLFTAFIALIIVFSVLLSVFSSLSYAADTPYFTAVNNNLLPFSKYTMPFISSGVIYVPSTIFSEFSIFSVSTELGRVHLYKGAKYVDFYQFENKSVDQDGREREGVSARKHNGIYYLPLGVVCSYFDLQYDFIPYDPIPILHVKSTEAINSKRILNNDTFIGVHKEKLQEYTDSYYYVEPPSAPPPEQSGTTAQPPPPPVTPAPTYENVTIYLNFYNVSAGHAIEILDLLAAPGYRACFFVSAEDITAYPGLIRRISGSGHSVGIWLENGTYEEYLETSALLFEAAKIKTVLVSSGAETESARNAALENGLVFWDAARSYGSQDRISSDTISGRLPTVSGARQSLSLECSENISKILPGLLSHLRKNFYNVSKITETASPI